MAVGDCLDAGVRRTEMIKYNLDPLGLLRRLGCIAEPYLLDYATVLGVREPHVRL